MKKIFTLFAAVVLAASVWADEIPQLNFTAALEKPNGVVNFTWAGDSTLSKYYYLTLSQIDMTTYKRTPIALILGTVKAYSTSTEGTFFMATNLMLQYGATYPAIKDDPEISDEEKAAFQAGWAYVDASDYTLAHGYYYVTVTGYAADKKTITEKQGYAVLDVQGKTQAIENIFESTKPVKFIENGQVRILRDGKVYDLSGALVR